MKNILFCLSICLLLNACTKSNSNLSDNYPIILEDSIQAGISNLIYEFDIDNDNETDIKIEQFGSGGMGGVSYGLDISVVDSMWKVGIIDKTLFICYDTLYYQEMEFYEKYSCDSNNTFIENESYSAIKVIEEEEFPLINNIKFQEGRFLIYDYYSYTGDLQGYFGNIKGTHYNIEKSAFENPDHGHGYIIFEHDNGLRLKMAITFQNRLLILKEIDIVEP